VSLAKIRIPVAVVSSIICLGLGVALGVLGLSAIWASKQPTYAAGHEDKARQTMAGYAKQMLAKTERGPSAKDFLALLVAKLDRLTAPPAKLALTSAERKQVLSQLEGLADSKSISEDNAQKRLDALLEILKEHKKALLSADTRANPFLEEENRVHLIALKANLEKQ
jgi:hypothetical protein